MSPNGREYTREWRERNPELNRERNKNYTKRYNEKHKDDPAQKLRKHIQNQNYQAKLRAKKQNELALEFQNGNCYTNLTLKKKV